MSSLLAILLVVNSTRGHHYLFSYPPDPQRPSPNRRRNNIKDFTVGSSITTRNFQADLEDLRRTSNANSNDTNTSTDHHDHHDSKRDTSAGRDTIFNLDVSFLADTLAPRSSLCDRKFQLTMDDLTFVGHPVSLTSPQQQKQQQQQQQTHDQEDQESSSTITPDNSPLSPTPHSQTSSPLAHNSPVPPISPAHQYHKRYSPNNTVDGNGKDNDEDTSDTDDDTNKTKDTDDYDDGNSTSDTSPGSVSIHMTLFHVVFVLSPPDLELNAQVETLYKNVILRYSSALRYEQLRCGYVQQEIEKVLGLKEEASNKGTPYNQVMRDILDVSSLAKDIRQIYNAISSNTTAHVIINDFIDLSLQIPIVGMNNVYDSFTNSDRENLLSSAHGGSVSGGGSVRVRDNYNGSSLMDIYSVAGYEYDNYPVLCPYHTLLLLEDPEEVLKNMPLDASPTLVQLVQILTPTQSLQELHLLLDCSLAQIYRLAAHLIYWRKAKLIHTISTRNIYVVSPNAKLDDIASLEADFRSHIPNLSLPVLLSKLSHAQQYHLVYHVKELKNQYLEAITYLIRKDLVVQLHMYLVLLVPSEKKIGNETPQSQYDGGGGGGENSQAEATMSSSPNNNNTAMNEPEWNRLKRLTYERAPKEVAVLFERLRPYMNGQHHIEEIIYREGISRKQLGLVLKYYRDKIVTVYHY